MATVLEDLKRLRALIAKLPATPAVCRAIEKFLEELAPVEGAAVKCSGCTKEFALKVKPRRGTRVYCDGCREAGVPVRDAVRDYRARKKFVKVSKVVKRVSKRAMKNVRKPPPFYK
jgi:hypothetical protein